ncbi:MAG: hypothetical protein FJ115_00335 [Deltaproteobacteria bacterium]|nr:hypothetical protein [Deltaproteobacteria bacterium]MBM4321977.1 hypothetical protein [Deltaproteobacteria bacterium]
MPDKKGNLYLFEAIELRKEYDRRIKLLEQLLGSGQGKQDRLFHRGDEEKREPSADLDLDKIEETLKNIQTKRVKLNQAIQLANFENKIEHEGETISIAEALELRKNLTSDLEATSHRVLDSAYTRIIHKEERDIVHEPRHSFRQSYEEFQNRLKKLRNLVIKIHQANHGYCVYFKDE